MRKKFEDMPETHEGIGSHYFAINGLGTEIDIAVTANERTPTSNERAIMLMNLRARAAMEAKSRGLPIGRDLGVSLPDKVVDVTAYVRIETVGGFTCGYKVTQDDRGRYVCEGDAAASLKGMVDRLVKRVERRCTVLANREDGYAQAMRFG